MDLSVVVPTLNGRDRLAACLDTISTHAPGTEVVVVNGPSADGTTGMVRGRDDVDVLVEVSTRTLNVARNAGIEVASGDAIALVRFDRTIEPGWGTAAREGLGEAAAVTGPVQESGGRPSAPERTDIGRRHVSYFNGGNVAFRAAALEALDGFDEYLETGGARDAAHRLAAQGYRVTWSEAMETTAAFGADGGKTGRRPYWKYRSLAYRLVKNYGVHPSVVRRIASHIGGEGVDAGRDLLGGSGTLTEWVGGGRDALAGTATGASDGFVARARDRSPARNPHGISKRADRAVARYDWR